MAEPTRAEILEAIAAAEAAGDDQAVSDLRERLGVGYGTSLGRGAAQGATFGLGDEIEGLIQAALPDPSGDTRSFFERYRRWRDAARLDNREAQAANPKTFTAGQIGGGVATAAAPGGLLGKLGLVAKAGQGANIGTRAAVGAANAVPTGLITGAGLSEADSAGGVVKDTAVGGLVAGGIGGTVSAVAPPLAEWLRSKGIEYGRKALSGISTPMSYTRKPIPEAAVEAAYDVGAIKPFGTVTGTAGRLETATDAQTALYDSLIDRLEQAGVTGPGAKALARRLMVRADAERPITWQRMDPIVGELEETAAEAVTKVNPLNTYTQGFDPPLGLSQTRALVGNAQRAASGEYAKIPNKVSMAGDSKMAVAGELRQALEDEVAAQAAKSPADAARFLPEKERLHNLLWALQEAREGAGKAARRGPLGLTDIVATTGAAAAGGLGPAAATLAATKIIGPRISSTVGSSARGASQLLNALGGTSSPAAGPGAASLSPAAAAELKALLAYLGRRPLGATDDGSEGGTR